MADEGSPDRLRDRYIRYVVSPDLFDDPSPVDPKPPGRLQRNVVGSRRVDEGPGAKPAPRVARVIIELNADFSGGVSEARREVLARLALIGLDEERLARARRKSTRYNVFAQLTRNEVEALTAAGREAPSPIYKVWRDERLKPFLNRSIRTIKADACLTAFGAEGRGIVFAIADSGIDGSHPHFVRYGNLVPPAGLSHKDFTDDGDQPLIDSFGHGTHVAGIVAGYSDAGAAAMYRVAEERDAGGTVSTVLRQVDDGLVLRGVAPRASLISLKVLDETGDGYASSLIAALEHVEELNDYGRRIKVHCVNLSLGYPFDAAWFAAGHSPLCAAVNRLSRSGVVMVAAAGNDGSALVTTEYRSTRQRVGMDQSINDPGNAEEAITVGATHGEAPHRYGVSYFSSRGPTADGRVKPDLVAPGERILSCAAAGSVKLGEALKAAKAEPVQGAAYFREESGTSMAAPHVSGAVAALLSIRPEFVGRAEAVKAVLMGNCVDLKRKADFQGAGLLDLMRAIQSI